MKRRIFALKDVLVCFSFAIPLIACAVRIALTDDFWDEYWMWNEQYYLHLFCLSLAIIFIISIRRFEIDKGNTAHFIHGFWNTRIKASDIDELWNQDVFISEIQDVKIVRLTPEEKKTLVSHWHLRNRYLKITLKNSQRCKYDYVGNYSRRQIRKIIGALMNTTA